jgi:hypothetical protein
MKSENRDLRELFEAFVRSKRPGDRQNCPSIQDLADSFDPKASRRKKKKIIDHLSECRDCREEFSLYLELNKLGGDPTAIIARATTLKAPRALRLSSVPRWRTAAVAVGLSLVLAGLFLFRNGEMPEAERNPTPTGIVLVEPLATRVVPDEIVFRWKALASAQHYILELFDETLQPLWVSPPVRDIETRLPADLAHSLKARASYFWMVSGYSGSSKIGESRLARFEVSDDPRRQDRR